MARKRHKKGLAAHIAGHRKVKASRKGTRRTHKGRRKK